MVPYGTSTWSPRYGQSICRSARGSGWGLIQCRAHKPSLFLSVTDKRHRTRAQYLCDTIVPSASCWSVRLSLARGQTAVTKKTKKKTEACFYFRISFLELQFSSASRSRSTKEVSTLLEAVFWPDRILKTSFFSVIFCSFIVIPVYIFTSVTHLVMSPLLKGAI